MYIALDTETTGIDLFHGAKPFAVSTCDEKGITNFWEWEVDPTTRQPIIYQDDIEDLCDYIDGSTLIFHNIKFDVRALRNIGINLEFKNISPYMTGKWNSSPLEDHKAEATLEGFEDTLLASHVCDSSEPHGLKYLAEEYIGILDLDEEELLEEVRSARRVAKARDWKVGSTLANVSSVHCDYWLPKAVNTESNVLETYSVQDAVRTMLLWKMYEQVIKRDKLDNQYQIRKSLIPISYRMESRGVTLKPRTLQSEIDRYSDRAIEEEVNCYEIAVKRKLVGEELNVRSSKQLQNVLYGDPEASNVSQRRGLGCPPISYTSTGISTSADTLRTLHDSHVKKNSPAHKFLESLLTYKKSQTCSQYLTSYQNLMGKESKRHVLHPSFNQTGTRTTRWSSSNPNGQNIGSGGKDAFGNEVNDYCLRDVFGPPTGYCWYAADYSQLELRILAVLAQEQKLIDAFERDEDIHSLTADLCGISRKAAKGVNYGLIYGAGKAKLELMTGKKGFDKVFKEAYPGISQFMSATTKQVNQKGFVKTIGGYRLIVPPEKPYIGTNYTIQGSAGDILNLAMIKLAEELGSNDEHPEDHANHLIMTIHDEIVVEAKGRGKSDIPDKMKQLMEEAGSELGVETPVDVKKITTKWSDGKELDI
tara:strand:+ start:19616 stop:21556 length:1941 start_codon:yes stop_codon:yes gene_type:complete